MNPKKLSPAQVLRKVSTEFLDSKKPTTAAEYKTTLKYLLQWLTEKTDLPFAAHLEKKKLKPYTILKHIKQAKVLETRAQLTLDLGNPLQKLTKDSPPKFSDEDFQNLYTGFADCKYPAFILPEFRPLYWQTIIHLVAVTAIRRNAVLNLPIDCINFQEQYVYIPLSIDKTHQDRYKPITPELAADLLDLLRHYDKSKIHPAQHNLVFPWMHGKKQWYNIWHQAEKKLGKRFHLHDLKRFSGELAMRAGASPLELQQHMDHSDIKTTLNFYCRPQTRKLVEKMKVPIPDRENKHTPMFGEGEILNIIQEIIHEKLTELGIEGHHVSLDKFGIPTNIDHNEIMEFEQRTRPKRKKRQRNTIPSACIYPNSTFWSKKEDQMIKTLARIAGNAAKALYLLIHCNGGMITRKEILDAGFKWSHASEIMLMLETDGHIFKITGGVYRLKESSALPEHSSAPPERSAPPEHCSAIPVKSSGRAELPVNVVNNMLTNKQANGVKISSTAENDKYINRCQIIEKAIGIDGLSKDSRKERNGGKLVSGLILQFYCRPTALSCFTL